MVWPILCSNTQLTALEVSMLTITQPMGFNTLSDSSLTLIIWTLFPFCLLFTGFESQLIMKPKKITFNCRLKEMSIKDLTKYTLYPNVSNIYWSISVDFDFKSLCGRDRMVGGFQLPLQLVPFTIKVVSSNLATMPQ